ncbi:MAG: mandelate racemase/muconate lactonizing enzyme family protein [Luteitalea sp.]|nr:mandelate racemase/muconate lactonizing enzyme family protein [Luteitalea sp.]
MRPSQKRGISRRAVLRRTAAAALAGPLFKATAGSVSAQSTVNKFSAPSDLKITDMRACRVAANYDYPIIKIYTNQDVYGLGEVRDAGVEGIALILKAHIVGRNPLEIEGILRRIRQFAGQGRMGGGFSAVDIALHDIAGKVYGVPAWRLLGNKLRDKIRIYADTTEHKEPKVYAERMRKRQEMGFTFFKMDLHTELVNDKPGAVDYTGAATDKGLEYLGEYIQAMRDVLGWETPLAADHFGRLTVDDAIRYAQSFEKFRLAWAEDFIAWRDWRGFKKITESSTTPILVGENSFGLEEGFHELIDNRAVDFVHPDLLTSGGLLETKRIADYANEAGIGCAMHMAGSPVGFYAGVHTSATLTNFVAMENHALDMPWWQDLVDGVPKPIINAGHTAVPDKPGLGVELNDEALKEHLRIPGYFEPTPMYDEMIVSGFNPGGPWPHYDEEGNWCNCVTYQ